MEMTATDTRFRLQVCERCGRETIHALRDPSTASGARDYRICSVCDAAAFERAAFEAGRKELLR